MSRRRHRDRHNSLRRDRDLDSSSASEVEAASSSNERHGRAVFFGLGMAVVAVLAIVVQRPYWTAVHFYDDEVHLHHISQVQMGDRTLVSDLFTMHNEHFLPLWKLGYHGTWRMAGMQPWAWHVGMTGMHIVSAWCVLLLGWRYLSTATAAISAAILWAGVAIAGDDHPLIWIASSHFAMSFTWLLLAMVCVTRLSGSRRWVWFGCMLLAVAAAVGTMGAMIFSVAVLPVQYWLLEAPRKNVLMPWPAWLCGWGGLCLVLIAVQLSCAAAGLAESAQPTDDLVSSDGLLSGLATRDPLRGVQATGTSIVVTFNQLLGGSTETTELRSAWPAMLLIAGLVAAVLLLRRYVNWRLLLVVWLAPGTFTLMVYLLRSNIGLQTLLSFTRYHYLPCMAWCMTLATVLEVTRGQCVIGPRCGL